MAIEACGEYVLIRVDLPVATDDDGNLLPVEEINFAPNRGLVVSVGEAVEDFGRGDVVYFDPDPDFIVPVGDLVAVPEDYIVAIDEEASGPPPDEDDEGEDD